MKSSETLQWVLREAVDVPRVQGQVGWSSKQFSLVEGVPLGGKHCN